MTWILEIQNIYILSVFRNQLDPTRLLQTQSKRVVCHGVFWSAQTDYFLLFIDSNRFILYKLPDRFEYYYIDPATKKLQEDPINHQNSVLAQTLAPYFNLVRAFFWSDRFGIKSSHWLVGGSGADDEVILKHVNHYHTCQLSLFIKHQFITKVISWAGLDQSGESVLTQVFVSISLCMLCRNQVLKMLDILPTMINLLHVMHWTNMATAKVGGNNVFIITSCENRQIFLHMSLVKDTNIHCGQETVL